jgi:predicted Holliday junction resolvase-like endonuclease
MRLIGIFEQKKMKHSILRGSKNQILGELYEKVLPALPDFPYAPKDMVFIGKGCDYIIFDGLTEGRLREVIFLELKSGNARLTPNEAMIKNVLDHKRVRFSEYRIASKRDS